MTPLILAQLCYVFEGKGAFPEKRSELYRECLDILLQTWDASRNIKRDDVYKDMDLDEKVTLLSYIAFQFFNKGLTIFKAKELLRKIASYLLLNHPERYNLNRSIYNEPGCDSILLGNQNFYITERSAKEVKDHAKTY